MNPDNLFTFYAVQLSAYLSTRGSCSCVDDWQARWAEMRPVTGQRRAWERVVERVSIKVSCVFGWKGLVCGENATRAILVCRLVLLWSCDTRACLVSERSGAVAENLSVRRSQWKVNFGAICKLWIRREGRSKSYADTMSRPDSAASSSSSSTSSYHATSSAQLRKVSHAREL